MSDNSHQSGDAEYRSARSAVILTRRALWSVSLFPIYLLVFVVFPDLWFLWELLLFIAVLGSLGGAASELAQENLDLDTEDEVAERRKRNYHRGLFGSIYCGALAALATLPLVLSLFSIQIPEDYDQSLAVIPLPDLLQLIFGALASGVVGRRLLRWLGGFLLSKLDARFKELDQRVDRVRESLQNTEVRVKEVGAEELASQALVAINQELPEYALLLAERSLRKSDNYRAHSIRGMAKKRLGELREAKDAVSRSITLAASTADVSPRIMAILYFNRACYRSLLHEKPEDIEADLSKAIELDGTIRRDIRTDEDLSFARSTVEWIKTLEEKMQ